MCQFFQVTFSGHFSDRMLINFITIGLMYQFSCSRFEYLWADGAKFKKPTALPAPEYVNHLMDWVEGQVNNEDIFPTKTGMLRF